MKLKKNLKQLMDRQHIRAAELARKLDLSPQTIGRWLKQDGGSIRNLHDLKKVADYFETTVDALLFAEDGARIDLGPLRNLKFEQEIAFGDYEIVLRRKRRTRLDGVSE